MNNGDAFITLPGGVGTFEEFFEVVVSRVVGEHQKPIGLLEANNFFDPLVKLFQHGIKNNFINPYIFETIIKSNCPSEILLQIIEGQEINLNKLMPQFNKPNKAL
tara:strand:- start:365 stop:679 length:315 start_codon:yes stop_codon:yes gene_type:complete